MNTNEISRRDVSQRRDKTGMLLAETCTTETIFTRVNLDLFSQYICNTVTGSTFSI
jgi:hypothetical protein